MQSTSVHSQHQDSTDKDRLFSSHATKQMNTPIWAASWENLFMPYANNKGADQPGHPRSLISAFAVRCLNSIISPVSIFAISWLSLASVSEQVSLSQFERLGARKTGLSPPVFLYWSFQGGISVVVHYCSCCLCLYFGSAIMLVTYFVNFR